MIIRIFENYFKTSMKKILAIAAFVCCFFSAMAEEGDWGVGASFGYASKLMKLNVGGTNYTLNQECNQLAVFLDRDISEKWGLTGEFDVYLPYRMKSKPPVDIDEYPEFNLFLAPYLSAGEDFNIGFAAGPVLSYSKMDSNAGLFYVDLGIKAWIGYNFNDEWGIFVNSRFEWDLYCNGYDNFPGYAYVPKGGSFHYGGFNASLGVRYRF